jgi:hypothetical protein
MLEGMEVWQVHWYVEQFIVTNEEGDQRDYQNL